MRLTRRPAGAPSPQPPWPVWTRTRAALALALGVLALTIAAAHALVAHSQASLDARGLLFDAGRVTGPILAAGGAVAAALATVGILRGSRRWLLAAAPPLLAAAIAAGVYRANYHAPQPALLVYVTPPSSLWLWATGLLLPALLLAAWAFARRPLPPREVRRRRDTRNAAAILTAALVGVVFLFPLGCAAGIPAFSFRDGVPIADGVRTECGSLATAYLLPWDTLDRITIPLGLVITIIAATVAYRLVARLQRTRGGVGGA